MSNISENIANLRKKKGITQEELGSIVGVSGQAVSKWETGGMPDCMLLPAIADALGCSIDELFGHSTLTVGNLPKKLFNAFRNSRISQDAYFDTFFELIWAIQNGYWLWSDEYLTFGETVSKHSGCENITSQIINDHGTTYLSLVSGMPLFVAVKDDPMISERLLSENAFPEFFSLFSDPYSLKAIFYTQTTECSSSHKFTLPALAEKIGIPEKNLSDIMPKLLKYNIFAEEEIALNDTVLRTYFHYSEPELRPLLMLAYQYIHARHCYYNFISGRSKAYL